MPDVRTPHPSAQQLGDYGLGKLSAENVSDIHDHLLSCEQCRRKVENLAPDSFIGRLRAKAPRGTTALPRGASLPPLPASSAPGTSIPPHKTPLVDTEVPPELAGSSKFQILGKLGQGGMGAVWKAKHNFLGDVVAIKVMNADIVAHPEARTRFLREMQAAGQLKHKNIVRALDAEQLGDVLVLVMEFVGGITLDRLVAQRGPLPVDFACLCIVQAALGLQHAHEKGMVHRDIKPANLIITPKEKEVKLFDFGLARGPRQQMDGNNQTQLQTFMGTPEYVAPEQATDARSADIRADIYSLGCTLYYLLAGRAPFQGDRLETIMAHIHDEPDPLTELRADIPEALWAVVGKMLAKAPAQRYQTPMEVADALRPFVKPGAMAAQSGSAPAPAVNSPGKRKRSASDTSQIAKDMREVPVNASAGQGWASCEEDSPFADVADGRPASWLAAALKRPAVQAATVSACLALILVAAIIHFMPPDSRPPRADNSTLSGGNQGQQLEDKGDPAPPRGAAAGRKLLAGINPKGRRSYKAHYGDWKKDGDELVQTAPGQDGLLVFGDFTWTDYDFSAEVNAASDTGCCALCFGVAAGRRNDFCIVNWGGASNDILAASREGNYKPLKKVPGGFQPDRWYPLRVRVRGKRCQCFREGRLIFDRAYDQGLQGMVGFWTEVTTVRFRNVLVTDPEGKALFAGLPEVPATADMCFATADPSSAHELHCLKGHAAPVHRVDFSRDGSRLVSKSQGEQRIWQARLGRFSLINGSGSSLRLWDAATGKQLDTYALAESPRDSPTPFRAKSESEWPYTMHFLTDLTGNDEGKVQRLGLWEIAGDRLHCRLLAPESIREFRYATVTPDRRRILALDQAGSIWEWDLAGKKLERGFPRGLKDVTTTAMAPDCRRALLARKNEAFAEIDLVTGQETGLWEKASGDVRCLVFSPDSKRVLAGEEDGTVRLWDVATRQELQRFEGHRGTVSAMVFSDDGRRALTGGADRTVRLWDLVGKRELACFSGHADRVLAVAFSPDGRRAASGSMDYTVRVWRLPP